MLLGDLVAVAEHFGYERGGNFGDQPREGRVPCAEEVDADFPERADAQAGGEVRVFAQRTCRNSDLPKSRACGFPAKSTVCWCLTPLRRSPQRYANFEGGGVTVGREPGRAAQRCDLVGFIVGAVKEDLRLAAGQRHCPGDDSVAWAWAAVFQSMQTCEGALRNTACSKAILWEQVSGRPSACLPQDASRHPSVKQLRSSELVSPARNGFPICKICNWISLT